MLPKAILAKDIKPNDLIICQVLSSYYNVRYIPANPTATNKETWTSWYFDKFLGKMCSNLEYQDNPKKLSLTDAITLCELVRKEVQYKYEVRPIGDQNLIEMLSVKETEEDDNDIIVVHASILSEKLINPMEKYLLKSDQKVFLIGRKE